MELSNVAIKETIVYTLENKANRSCKEEKLPADVLKYLALPLRGRKRQEFCRELRIASGQLQRAKIIVRYQTPMNVRLRLTKKYKKAFERLSKKWAREARKAENNNLIQPKEVDLDKPNSNQKLLFPEITDEEINDEDLEFVNIPNIPDLDDQEDDYQNTDIIHDEYEHDDDTIDLLNALTNSELSEDQDESIILSNGEAGHQEQELSVLDILNTSLGRTPGITVESSFNELIVHAKAMEDSITANITHGALDNLLRIQTYIPFAENAAINLLDLSGKMDFNSTIGTTSISGKKKFIVKNSIFVTSTTKDYLMQIIIQTLSDAFKALKIIKNS